MNISVFLSSLLFIFCFCPVNARGVNGGMSCAVCTVVTGIAMQDAEVHEEGLLNATKRICDYLPNKLRNSCFNVMTHLEPYVTDFSEKLTPDLFCLMYGTCKLDQKGELCHLFPLPLDRNEIQILQTINEQTNRLPKLDFCSFPYIGDICRILNNSYISLQPLEDFDGDGFSAMESGRGFDWRGRDCAENDPEVYPGRRPLSSDFNFDSNCNGIWGFENSTLQSWEEILCKKSKPRGLIYIGDSIGAHFHMPEVWINPLLFTLPGLNASNVILDEIDWPQFGFATGFKNITNNLLINGSMVDSIYLRMRNRNRCNHRDYQNLSQNGASSYEAMNHTNSISRNQSVDNPALVIYAMQGNDVCNNFNETEKHMTPPPIFRKNIMAVLSLLDKKLPKNSHVVLVELTEADFIYSAMAERLHPIGTLHKNVRYKNMYDWFNCMQIGPCTGWLNSNETLRNITSEKARELNAVLRDIAKNERFQNFDLYSIKNPITYLVRQERINISEFLESVDSLHPNQGAQPLLADVVWQSLKQLPRDVLGPVNPHNGEIEKIFGNQGGH